MLLHVIGGTIQIKHLLLLSYFDSSIDSYQQSFLNLKLRDVALSMLELDSFDENDKKKRAQWRIHMVDVSANSYSKQLNSSVQMANMFIERVLLQH